MFALRSCRAHTGFTVRGIDNERGTCGKKKNSRGSGKRDHVIAERADPRDAQLRDRDAFPIRYGRQTVHKLEVMSDILVASGYVRGGKRSGDVKDDSYFILETTEPAPEVAFFEILKALELTGE
jgi:hypothetical protein